MILEVQVTPDLLNELRDYLAREGAVLACRDMSSPFALVSELARRRGAAADLVAGVLEILQRHAIKPLDLEVLEAGHRLLTARANG